MNIGQRIKVLLAYKDISQADLAKEFGVSRGAVNQWINGDKTIGYDTIYRFLNKFQDLNARWFILGTGDMLEKQEQSYQLPEEIDRLVAESLKKYGLEKPKLKDE